MERDKTFESPVPTLIVIDMWLQNEHTDQLPNGVDRRTFAQLLGQE